MKDSNVINITWNDVLSRVNDGFLTDVIKALEIYRNLDMGKPKSAAWFKLD